MRRLAKTQAVPAAELLTSRENHWLKKFRLALRTGECADGCVGVEGVRIVEDALRSGLPVEAILVSAEGEKHLKYLRASLETSSAGTIRILRTTDRLFSGVAGTETPQGVAALVKPRTVTFEDLLRAPHSTSPLIVTLVALQDPGNVGTILRAAEAFGATAAATCSFGAVGTSNPHSPKTLRASAGSALRLPILHGVGISILLTQFRLAGIKVVAATAGTLANAPPVLFPWQATWNDPTALLIGNEGAGLPEEIERSADALLRIPLSKSVESLNAAVAAAVLLYEASRQRSRS
jgi:TrmH family RNA methyltransferase